ncbi:Hypp7986 [Branchiostoma lanceolatum]|uniref:Hypp7986 protein n=1 Tax=Branchiostoma lanceolatum TaxID=7740 RepID=A0A8J9Z4S1_BRALA|nr:Hypp7986 [Branchiostoma lanceolatum]
MGGLGIFLPLSSTSKPDYDITSIVHGPPSRSLLRDGYKQRYQCHNFGTYEYTVDNFRSIHDDCIFVNFRDAFEHIVRRSPLDYNPPDRFTQLVYGYNAEYYYVNIQPANIDYDYASVDDNRITGNDVIIIINNYSDQHSEHYNGNNSRRGVQRNYGGHSYTISCTDGPANRPSCCNNNPTTKYNGEYNRTVARGHHSTTNKPWKLTTDRKHYDRGRCNFNGQCDNTAGNEWCYFAGCNVIREHHSNNNHARCNYPANSLASDTDCKYSYSGHEYIIYSEHDNKSHNASSEYTVISANNDKHNNTSTDKPQYNHYA